MKRIERALKLVDRADFMPEDVRDKTAWDMALPIGYGQTISQPTTVEMMLRWLEPEPGNMVMDVGSGSGWTTALLAKIVGPKGRVIAVELVPELVVFGRENCRRAGIKNATFHQAGKQLGWPQSAPYDRILVSAAADELPVELLDQLSIGGKLVVPVRNDILEVEKTSQDAHEIAVHSGFIFVPLIY